MTFFTIHCSICFHAVRFFVRNYLLCNFDNICGITLPNSLQQIIAINLRRKMKSRKTRIGIFVVFTLQCRVECPSVAFFIVYLCPSGKYSSETIEKLTFSYTFLYCEKQFRYLILVCMFPIAGACAEFSCRPEIRGVALLPILYSVIQHMKFILHLLIANQYGLEKFSFSRSFLFPVKHNLNFKHFSRRSKTCTKIVFLNLMLIHKQNQLCISQTGKFVFCTWRMFFAIKLRAWKNRPHISSPYEVVYFSSILFKFCAPDWSLHAWQFACARKIVSNTLYLAAPPSTPLNKIFQQNHT